MAKLVVNSESLVSVADAIRTKGGTSESLEFPQGFVDAVGAIESGGGGTEEIENIIDQSGVLDSTDGTVEDKVELLVDKAEWEKAWYRQTENMITAQRLFINFGNGGNGYSTIPRTNFVKCTNFAAFCENANIAYVDYLIGLNNVDASADRMFFASEVKRIKGLGFAITSATSLFHASSIEEIDEPLEFSADMSSGRTLNAFNCSYLREIRFVSETIKWSIAFTSAVLSAESLQSIIDGLATVETAQTLTLNATVKAKLTEEQLATITNKNWNLA